MGFFNNIFKALGFESEQEEKTQKKVREQSGSFELSEDKHYKKLPPVRNVQNQIQLQETIEELKQKKHMIFDFSNFDESIKYRAIDFLAGAVFALDGDLEMIDENKISTSLEIEED